MIALDRSQLHDSMLTAKRPAKLRYTRPERYLENPDAIVIGSGIGGLGIASFLTQKRGMRVLLLEANVVPGGCTHVHELSGFEFPSGLDSVGDMNASVGMGMNRPNMDFATGGKLDWERMPDVHEVSCFGDDVFEWHSDHEKNIEWVLRHFPGEGNVRAYYELEDKIERAAWSWALTKVYPEWLPLGMREGLYRMVGGRWRNSMAKSAIDVFTHELGFSQRLAAVFSYMYGNYGRLPHDAPFGMHATFLAHYRHGAYYPKGGPGQIAECIVPIIESGGGQVATSSPVKSILIERGRAAGVVLESGETIRSKLVVSDAGAHITFEDLLPKETAIAAGLLEKCATAKASPAHLYLMLGFDEPLNLPRHIIWHMARGGGFSPYDIAGADAHWKQNQRFDDMACYILSPSARDSTHAHRYPGKSTIMALAECPPGWVARMEAEPSFAQDLSGRLAEGLRKIIERHVPEIRGKTPAFQRSGAPIGCNPRARHGASYGVELSPDRFFSHTHWLRPQTPIPGLYLTGQDAFLPGICGSLLAARFTYSAITGDPFFLLQK